MKGRKPKSPAACRRDGYTSHIGPKEFAERIKDSVPITVGFPECPAHLKGIARRTWEFLSVELAKMQQDRRPDAMMLEGVCVAYSQAVEADKDIGKNGLMIDIREWDEGAREFVVVARKANPAEQMSRRAWAQVKAFSVEFGLTPVSRVRLSVSDAPAMDDWEAAQCESINGIPSSALQ